MLEEGITHYPHHDPMMMGMIKLNTDLDQEFIKEQVQNMNMDTKVAENLTL